MLYCVAAQLALKQELDELPTLEETTVSVEQLTNRKIARVAGTSLEVWKYGGQRSEGCSLHVVALLDSIWIDKLHRLSLPTGKWAQLPFFGPASHWNPQSGWHYSYSKRETLRATQAPKIVNSPLRPDHSDNNTQFNNTLACNHITP